MDFQEMYKKVTEGHKARRPHWKDSEFLWSFESILVHSRPYFSNDEASIWIGDQPRYYYVVERDDPIAKDWELIQI